MVTKSRWVGWLSISVMGTAVAAATSEATLANWMTPAWMQPRTHHWFQVSPDECHVAVCESNPGESTRRRVLDIRTGDEVDVDPDAWLGADRKTWYSRRQAQTSDNTTAVTIAWNGHEVERTFLVGARNHSISLTSAEGIVFEHVWDRDAYALVRHELASGESRTLVRANPRSSATISPDGERVLLSETAFVSRKDLPEHRGVKILDGRNGSELGWIEAPWTVAWIGSAHRHVQTELEGRLTVLDLERGTRVSLETRFSTLAPVEVLGDGSILLQDGDALTLHDCSSGAVLRSL